MPNCSIQLGASSILSVLTLENLDNLICMLTSNLKADGQKLGVKNKCKKRGHFGQLMMIAL